MLIYKVRYDTLSEESSGFFFAATLKEAKANTQVLGYSIEAALREITKIEVKCTKKGIIDSLNYHTNHNATG